MKIVINHTPHHKKRPRFRRFKNFVTTYDPQKKEATLTKYKIAKLLRDNDYIKEVNTPLFVSITSYMPKPKSWSNKKKEAMEGMPCMVKPDVDNISKFYLDCMNKIAYDDDKFVTKLFSEKVYSDLPRVEINIEKIAV